MVWRPKTEYSWLAETEKRPEDGVVGEGGEKLYLQDDGERLAVPKQEQGEGQ